MNFKEYLKLHFHHNQILNTKNKEEYEFYYLGKHYKIVSRGIKKDLFEGSKKILSNKETLEIVEYLFSKIENHAN